MSKDIRKVFLINYYTIRTSNGNVRRFWEAWTSGGKFAGHVVYDGSGNYVWQERFPCGVVLGGPVELSPGEYRRKLSHAVALESRLAPAWEGRNSEGVFAGYGYNESRVAHAICEANPDAGQPHGEEDQLSTERRAWHLLRLGYVREGDPQGWGSGGRSLATIYLEPKGGAGDCGVPWGWGQLGVSIAASDRMYSGSEGSPPLRAFIEDVNSAVSLVCPSE